MKTLVIVGHNDLTKSTFSKAIVEALRGQNSSNITIHILSQKYVDYKIDVKAEQDLLLEHERIVFVFPVQWYSVPALLKKWEEDVLLSGFAYGKDGDKLKGKITYFIATSAGNPEDYSLTGYNNYPIMDFFKPFEQTVRLCSMDVRMPMFYQGVYHREKEEGIKILATEALKYVAQEDVPAWPPHGKDLKPKLI